VVALAVHHDRYRDRAVDRRRYVVR